MSNSEAEGEKGPVTLKIEPTDNEKKKGPKRRERSKKKQADLEREQQKLIEELYDLEHNREESEDGAD